MAAVDISTLSIRVDAKQPAEAAKQLNALTKASDRTVDSVTQLEVSSASVTKQLREQTAATVALARAELQTTSGRQRRLDQLNQIIAKEKERAASEKAGGRPSQPKAQRETLATGDASKQLELFNKTSQQAAATQAKVETATKASSAAIKEQANATRISALSVQQANESNAQYEARLRSAITASQEKQRLAQAEAAAQAKATAAQKGHTKEIQLASSAALAQMDVTQRRNADEAALDRTLAKSRTTLMDVYRARGQLNAAYEMGAIDAEKFAEGQKKLAAEEKKLLKVTQDEQKAVDALVRTYAPASAQLAKLAADEKKLTTARNAGKISADDYAKAMARITVNRAQIQATEQEVGKLSATIKKLGLNTNQSARDMVTFVSALGRGDFGLAANQIAQIGSRTGALRAIFNPVTLGITGVVVAVGALTAAFIQGQRQTAAFNIALQATGNYAGVTSTQLEEMVGHAQEVSNVSSSAAREIVTSLVASGRMGKESIGLIADAAANLATVTGKTAQQASADLSGMLEDPLQGALELNKQYHFLTLAQFEYVQGLTDVTKGHVTAADKEKARIAILEAFNAQMKDVDDNLGYVDQAFKFAAKSASDFWDAIRGIGREKSAGETLKELNEQLERARGGFLRAPAYFVQQLEAKRDEAKAQVAREQALAEEKRTSGLIAEEQIAAKQRWTERVAQSRTAKEQLEFELQSIRDTALALGKAASDTDVAEQLRRAQISSAPVQIAKGLNEQIAALKLTGKTTDEAAMATARLNAQAQLLAQGYSGELTPAIEAQIAALGGATQQAALTNARIQLEAQGKALAFQADNAERAAAVQRQLAAATGDLSPALQAVADDWERVTREQMRFQLQAQLARDNIKMLPKDFEDAINKMVADSKRINIAEASVQALELLEQANLEILRETGRGAEAAAREIENAFKKTRMTLETAGMATPENTAVLDRQQEVRQAAAERTRAATDMERIQDDFARRQQKIQLDIEAGLITEYEARQQVITANKQQADELEKLIPIYQEIATITGSAADAAAVDRLTLKIRELRQNTNELKQTFGQAFEGALADGIHNFAMNVESLGEVVRSVILSIADAMARWAAEGLANMAKVKLMEMMTQSTSAAGGAVAGAAGGAAQTAATTAAATAAATTAATAIGTAITTAGTVAAGAMGTGITTAGAGAATVMGGAITSAGAAAATAMAAAITTASGASSAGSAFAGFAGAAVSAAEGGWTGPGSKYTPAGIVHADEWVVPKSRTNEPGAMRFLDSFNRYGMKLFRGYAEGGKVAPPTAAGALSRSRSQVLVGLADGLVLDQLSSDKGTELLVKKFARNPAQFRGALGL